MGSVVVLGLRETVLRLHDPFDLLQRLPLCHIEPPNSSLMSSPMRFLHHAVTWRADVVELTCQKKDFALKCRSNQEDTDEVGSCFSRETMRLKAEAQRDPNILRKCCWWMYAIRKTGEKLLRYSKFWLENSTREERG